MSTDLLSELEAVAGLAEKATPGPWVWSENGNILGHMPDGYDETREVGAIYTERDDDLAPANAEAIIAAVNFLRAHHAEIAAAVRDAAYGRALMTAMNCEHDAAKKMPKAGKQAPWITTYCLLLRLKTAADHLTDAAMSQEGEG